MSLWDIAIDECRIKNENKDDSVESTMLFIGNKSSGKTSVITRFLDREEIPKPTVALEYTFGRRTRGHNLAKDVAHIFEIGGGTWLSKLIDIAVSAESITQLSVVIVLDLSQPKEMWHTFDSLLKATKQRIEFLVDKLSAKDVTIKEQLKAKIDARLGEHPEKDMIDPFPVPLLIIGGKHDLFMELEPEKRKIICKTLRFLAHYYGANLQFFSTRTEALQNRIRGIISHYAFGTNDSKTLQVDHSKPLMVPSGYDSFQQIGGPPVNDDDFGRLAARTPVDLWQHAFTAHFPPEKQTNLRAQDDPAVDPQYAEPAVDAARTQMNEELEKYRKVSDRKMRDLMQQAINEGIMTY